MTATDLPAWLKAGHMTYTIEVFPPLEAASVGRYGQTNHFTRVIKIDIQHGALQAAETLLHECLHVIFRLMNIEDEDKEERTVTAMSIGLAILIRDNPSLMAYIEHNIQHGS